MRGPVVCFDSVECYDKVSGYWSSVAAMQCSRVDFGAAVLQGQIFAVGGKDYQGVPLNTVERYDPVTVHSRPADKFTAGREWFSGVPLRIARCCHCVGVLHDQLYAIGGFSNNQCLSSVERYNPTGSQWSFVAALNTARCLASAAVLQGQLYVVGGFFDATSLNTVERYDPVLNQWFFVAPMNTARHGHGVAVLNERLYAVGGTNGVMGIECYDPSTNRWEVVGQMDEHRYYHTVTCLS